MTRETKIGMLVGLGVIVLIGILLSEYLGDGAKSQQQADLGKYRGEEYRQTMEKDIGMPSARGNVPGNGAAVVPNDGTMAMAVGNGNAGPVMGQPVLVQEVGAVPPDMRQDGGTPVALLADRREAEYVPGTQGQVGQAQVVIRSYMVAKNDTVKGLARKFYGAAGTAEVGRLVAANPGVIKDGGTMLIIGRKLNVPTLVSARAAVPVPAPRGVAPTPSPVRAATPANNAGTFKAYTVVKGDTISGIAKKVMGTGGPISVSEIYRANGLKEGAMIREGMVLKVPVKGQ